MHNIPWSALMLHAKGSTMISYKNIPNASQWHCWSIMMMRCLYVCKWAVAWLRNIFFCVRISKCRDKNKREAVVPVRFNKSSWSASHRGRETSRWVWLVAKCQIFQVTQQGVNCPIRSFSPITCILSDWYFPIGDPGEFRVLSLYPTGIQRQGHSAG